MQEQNAQLRQILWSATITELEIKVSTCMKHPLSNFHTDCYLINHKKKDTFTAHTVTPLE